MAYNVHYRSHRFIAMATQPSPNSSSSEFPGLLSLVEVNRSSNILQAEGDDAETLAGVLVYFNQMTDLIGESLGLDGIVEGRMIGRSMTAVCLPTPDSIRGALFENRANIDAVLPKLLPEE